MASSQVIQPSWEDVAPYYTSRRGVYNGHYEDTIKLDILAAAAAATTARDNQEPCCCPDREDSQATISDHEQGDENTAAPGLRRSGDTLGSDSISPTVPTALVQYQVPTPENGKPSTATATPTTDGISINTVAVDANGTGTVSPPKQRKQLPTLESRKRLHPEFDVEPPKAKKAKRVRKPPTKPATSVQKRPVKIVLRPQVKAKG
ncbi:hypothetical protein F4808DRAFT_463372 [Astrocystis sublimbata]|nr:hypothetical protein F4808DRAFT_463372 [Astrocystis sublimbata]